MSTITRKPNPEAVIPQSPVSEAQIARVIQKGGSAPSTRTRGAVVVNLRVPEDILAQVDAAVATQQPKISRHHWLLAAVLEKLARDA